MKPEGLSASPMLHDESCDNVGSILFKEKLMAEEKRKEKTFKSFLEQIEGLKKKNLKFKNEDFALNILEKVNYYSLINGYKDIFLDSNYIKQNDDDPDEKYKEDTYFEDIFYLYYFDTELRNVLLRFIFEFEENIKTKIAYYFTEKFKENNNAYLKKNNFDYEVEALQSSIDKLVKKLEKTIEKQKSIRNSRINHYSTYYNTIPLWVLMPQLDFGTTSFFFRCCTKDIQSKVAKHLKEDFSKNYPGINKDFVFTAEALVNIMFFINSFRNICAHNERAYNHVHRKNTINTTILHNHLNLKFKYSVFDLILVLKIFMDPLKYNFAFKNLIGSPLAFLNLNLGEERFIKIMKKMKFPIKWGDILNMEFESYKQFYNR